MKVIVAIAAVALTGCGQDVAADHGACYMQALQSKLAVPEQVEFVDACMRTRGYETHTAFSDANCSTSYGVRIPACYASRSFMERIAAQFR